MSAPQRWPIQCIAIAQGRMAGPSVMPARIISSPDDVGGDEIGAAELFLSGGVGLCREYGRTARQAGSGSPASGWTCASKPIGDPEQSPGDLTVFDAIRVYFEMRGHYPEHAEGLVETWKRRCPLYGSVATATEDTAVTRSPPMLSRVACSLSRGWVGQHVWRGYPGSIACGDSCMP